MCDQCSTPYSEELPSWMMLTFPNAGGVVEPDSVPEYDFCTYQCLEAWVNEDDTDEEPENAIPEDERLRLVQEASALITEDEKQNEAQAKLDAAMAQMNQRPQMSLADAIASGELKFDRGPQ